LSAAIDEAEARKGRLVGDVEGEVELVAKD